MELLNTASSIRFFSCKNPYKFRLPSSRYRIIPSFSVHLPLTHNTKFQISAHFGRPRARTRRNSLRKKLTSGQKQVSPSYDFQSPVPSFDDTESFRHDSNLDSVEKENDWKNSVVVDDVDVAESNHEREEKMKTLAESALLSKLERWVDHWENDAEYSDEQVERVLVNEEGDFKDLGEVESKGFDAREIESEKDVIPRNTSVAKVVVSGQESGLVQSIPGFPLGNELVPKLSRVGSVVLCGFLVFWAIKKLFGLGNNEVKYTAQEKEMMKRKIKARKEKELLKKGSVEVVRESTKSPRVFTEKPKLDKQQLLSTLNAWASNREQELQDSSSIQKTASTDFDAKVLEIKKMARKARLSEGKGVSLFGKNGEEKQAINQVLPYIMKVAKQKREKGKSPLSELPNGYSQQTMTNGGTIELAKDEPLNDDSRIHSNISSLRNGDTQTSSISSAEVLDDRQSTDSKDSDGAKDLTDSSVGIHSGSPEIESPMQKKSSSRMKPVIIRSVEEAREYLSKKRYEQEPNQDGQIKSGSESHTISRLPIDTGMSSNESQGFEKENKEFQRDISDGTSDSVPYTNVCGDFSLQGNSVPTKKEDSEDCMLGSRVGDLPESQTSSNTGIGSSSETGPSVRKDNWVEKNFHEVEPIVNKIEAGFRDSYMVAKEKANQQLEINAEPAQLDFDADDGELDWMKDDNLREIVFRVRENELTGKDPFYLMDAEDKAAFFKGLEQKVEKVNEKLSGVHEWLHSNIENLDYGADGISVYDPPEKMIPRWKGPPLEKSPEFLNNFQEERKTFFAGKTDNSTPSNKNEQNLSQKSTDMDTSLAANESRSGNQRKSKTVVEGSDGSTRDGKRSGKEFWQHTKKWTREFLECYNAETDPEIKSIMKDMGKDLDRWLTDDELKNATSDSLTRVPKKNKEFIQKKLNKLKWEVELYGPQAVASKYREYGEDKEEDYLWWLDLPFVLCIELYIVKDGEKRVGFYSLEMAEDLELEPKPCHVIAFENANDCKNLCYIIQAHLDVLGDGHAFVVPRPPKDAFREAKANGFSVTVIRKGELNLNVDQTLEEVEELITEIGSKMYHDMITKERSLDMGGLMKGVFGFSGKPTKRKMVKGAKQTPKKPGKK